MSTRITKEVATKIARILTTKKSEELKQLENNLSDFITKIYEETLPPILMQGFLKFPEYYSTNSGIYLSGASIQPYEFASFSKNLPINGDKFELKVKQAEQYIKLKRGIEAKKADIKKLNIDVAAAIFNARTYKKVCELFPEAAEHLPPVYPVLAINYSDIRKRIK